VSVRYRTDTRNCRELSAVLCSGVKAGEKIFERVGGKTQRDRAFWSLGREQALIQNVIQHSPGRPLRKSGNSTDRAPLEFAANQSLLQ